MRGWPIAASVALCLSLPAPACAQQAQSLEVGFLTSALFEDSELYEDAVLLIGYRVAAAKQGRVGVDFSVGTLPQLFSDVVVMLPHLDLVAPVAISGRSWLMPRAGFSAIMGASSRSGGALGGFNLGIGWLGRTGERTGVRLDLTYMRLIANQFMTEGITTLTFGYAWIK